MYSLSACNPSLPSDSGSSGSEPEARKLAEEQRIRADLNLVRALIVL